MGDACCPSLPALSKRCSSGLSTEILLGLLQMVRPFIDLYFIQLTGGVDTGDGRGLARGTCSVFLGQLVSSDIIVRGSKPVCNASDWSLRFQHLRSSLVWKFFTFSQLKVHVVYRRIVFLTFRDWPQPVLLKAMAENNSLGLQVWDPRVSCVYQIDSWHAQFKNVSKSTFLSGARVFLNYMPVEIFRNNPCF